MTTLRSEHRWVVHIYFILMVVGFLTAVFLYYKVTEFNQSGNTKIKIKYGHLDRSKTGLLIEYRDKSVADKLSRQVRVLCWVMTQPRNHERVQNIIATWGKRCNVLLFMSTVANETLQTIGLPVQEGQEYQWAKTKAAFRYVYKHHRDDADWFMKADDDTYVIVENLRYMLAEYNSKDLIYFGCRFKHNKKKISYMSGGAGYVISRAALDKLMDEGLSGPTHCRVYEHGDEDLEMGICLSKIGVEIGDSRDRLRRGRFFPFRVKDHLFPDQDSKFWYWNYAYYPTRDGLNCCSEYAISFHYIEPNDMYVLDYLIYKLRPYGIEYKTDKKPAMLTMKPTTLKNKSTNATKKVNIDRK